MEFSTWLAGSAEVFRVLGEEEVLEERAGIWEGDVEEEGAGERLVVRSLRLCGEKTETRETSNTVREGEERLDNGYDVTRAHWQLLTCS